MFGMIIGHIREENTRHYGRQKGRYAHVLFSRPVCVGSVRVFEVVYNGQLVSRNDVIMLFEEHFLITWILVRNQDRPERVLDFFYVTVG